ncbi:MAG: hypothetical protein LIO54_03625 [Oscillospiraceae bacterium]|nr:hypothetical protein [Oscillospiraceae bacterium]
MATNLLNQVSALEQDNLIARLSPPAETTAVYLTVADGETVKRGTILTATDNVAAPLAAALSANTPVFILCDDTTGDETGQAAVGVYRSGNFNRNAVLTDGTYELTETDIDILRTHGIILTDMREA